MTNDKIADDEIVWDLEKLERFGLPNMPKVGSIFLTLSGDIYLVLQDVSYQPLYWIISIKAYCPKTKRILFLPPEILLEIAQVNGIPVSCGYCTTK